MLRQSIFVAFLVGVVSTLGCAEECSVSSTAHESFEQGEYVYTFDNEGTVLSFEVDADGDGTAERRATYTRDADGNPLILEERDADGNLTHRTTFTSDSKGNVLSQERRDAADEVVFRSTYSYTYNDAGEKVFRQTQDAEGNVTVSRFSYTYDEDGNILIEEEQYVLYEEERRANGGMLGPRLISWTRYTYDERGNRLTRVNALGQTTYTYTCG